MIRNYIFAAVTGVAITLPSTASAQQRQECQAKAEHQLKEYNIEYGDTQDPRWVTKRWSSRRQQRVANYTLQIHPPSCNSGHLVIIMLYDCSIESVYTDGGCRIKGVSPLE